MTSRRMKQQDCQHSLTPAEFKLVEESVKR